MKNALFIFTLWLSLPAAAQYYYEDIVGTQALNQKMQAYQAARVKSVTATGYDPEGRKSTDFNEWQEVQNGGRSLRVSTRNGQSIARTYYEFDDHGRVISARDSSGDIQTQTAYQYDAQGNLVNLLTTTRDALHDFDQTKERQYRYQDGKPATVLVIQNREDSLEYQFSLDSAANVKDEMLYHRGGSKNQVYYSYNEKKVYYFYDDLHRLTDITRYNAKIDRLLPDVMFEYDEQNRVIQRITVLSTVRYDTKQPDYLIWRYAYDARGLKTKEVLYNKAREFKGRIDYSYSTE